jgi:adenosine deaminase
MSRTASDRTGVYLTVCAVALLIAASVAAAEPAAETQAAAAERAVLELERVRDIPLALRDFLKRMPKGADLHNHLDGAVYAETFIRVGAEDHLCIDTVAKAFSKSQPIKSGAEPEPVCEAGDVPATDAFKNQPLYDELVDSFSMRGFVPSEAVTGHDHFFGTFAKFDGTDPRHTGEFLDEVSSMPAPGGVFSPIVSMSAIDGLKSSKMTLSRPTGVSSRIWPSVNDGSPTPCSCAIV